MCAGAQVPDWRLIDYGKGAGLVAAEAERLASSLPPDATVILDPTDPTDREVSHVLRRMAAVVIQGYGR